MMAMRLSIQATQRKRRRARPEEPDPDPVVAYRLVAWAQHAFASDRDMAIALTADRGEAKAMIQWLSGPWTSGDIDVRSITRSELAALKASATVNLDGTAAV